MVNLRFQPFDVYVGRAGQGYDGTFGNPFPPLHRGDRLASIERYRVYFFQRVEVDPTFRAAVLALRGLRLGCFCAPCACHGEVIANWLNHPPPTQG